MAFENKLLRVFLDTDMRNQHDGLILLAKTRGVDPKKLKPGEHLLFVNRGFNKLKMVSSNAVISYLKMPGTRRIDAMALAEIPRLYTGNLELSYSKAIEKRLKSKMR